MRMRLLNPGPVTLSRRVRESLMGQDLCHRCPEFGDLQSDVRARLAAVYPEAAQHYAAVLVTGSGTAAVEAMVGSLVPKDGKALVVANGVYGERIASMLQIHKTPYEVIRSDAEQPMNVAEVDRRLAGDHGISHVIAVHHETTTGRLNVMSVLGEICRERQVSLLLDAVSSFGGERLDFENWNLQACAATANKCLHGVPGVSFVLARREILKMSESNAPCLYLDLFRNFREQEAGYPLFTPAVQVTYALQEALRELEEQGGWQRRRQQYQQRSEVVRRGLLELGQELLLDEQHCSPVLTSFRMPEGIDFDNLYRELKARGFVIYPGQRALNGKIFRIAVMGDLTEEDMREFVRAFHETVSCLGGDVIALAAPV